MCHPMVPRQAYYKYITVTFVLSACLEFPRFFEIRFNDDMTHYWTSNLMENPLYVRFNSYWNELFATGIAPLISLCYMNLKIFLRIKVSVEFIILDRISSSCQRFRTIQNVISFCLYLQYINLS